MNLSGIEMWMRIVEISEEWKDRKLEEFAMIIWALWKARNLCLCNKKFSQEEDIIGEAVSYLHEYQAAEMEDHDQQLQKSSSSPVKWKPPDDDTFKVNIDGAFKDLKARVAAVVRGKDGKIVASMAHPVSNVIMSQHLEAIAIGKGIALAEELGLNGYIIESDCQEVVNKINSCEEDFSAIGHIIQLVKQDSKNPRCLAVNFTRRTANIPAHQLAKFACNLDIAQVWVEECPECILTAVSDDLNE